MIHTLSHAHPRLRKLACLFPEPRAVLEGNSPGWVFGDDPRSPRSALVWVQGMEGFYLLGDPDNSSFLADLDQFIVGSLRSLLLKMGTTWCEISGGPNWHEALEKAFAQRKLQQSRQLVFTMPLEPGVTMFQNRLLEGCAVQPVNRKFLRLPETNDEGTWKRKVLSCWGSTSAYLRQGIGYAVTREHEVLSLCFSAFVSHSTHVVDIETHPQYRRQGLARQVAEAYGHECRRRDFDIHWDCMAENEPSANLARVIGLVHKSSYTLLSFKL